ncbi:SOS response-associated peptidase [Legionella sp. W05-934-2]|jgi:putative SOS response-associated peptidase YedK|uniref:SOS response-associated peptidase n=1 Tax=Legionella sp. W05-934-2 TaxID=1198649 RepID=UPI003462D979
MCGRFALYADEQMLKNRYQVTNLPFMSAHFNIAPTQTVFCVTNQDGHTILKNMYWGLIPHWSKDKRHASKMINARAETVEEKPAFRSSFKSRRCIVPMSGFFEWVVEDGQKKPYFITNQENLLSVAAIYDSWHDDNENQWIMSCAVLTTSANSSISTLHKRMPLILSQEDENEWLEEGPIESSLFSHITHECQNISLSYYPVTEKVNKASYQDQKAVLPLR